VARVAAVPLTGTAIGFWMALLLCAKGLIVATVLAALSARARADGDQISELEQWIERLQADARKRNHELAEMEVSSAEAHAKLRNEADVVRRQLTTLQSVTDPALDTLDGAALVTSLLDRVRLALGADGVALHYFDGLGGRIFVAGSGLQPLGKGKGRLPASSDCQNGRSVLIHNDAGRVADTSLCQWPDDVTSLIAVPVVHAGRLQLVVEVANQKARRSTEWELALILVVAERAAGLLRQDANARTGALA
jgi:GAF domain-containing protein